VPIALRAGLDRLPAEGQSSAFLGTRSVSTATIEEMEETTPNYHLASNRSDSEAVDSNRPWRRTPQLSRRGYALAVLTVAALILRLISLNSKGLWLDEAWSAYWAAETLRHLTKVFLQGAMNMALYHVILHWWSQLVGSSEISLRLPSVIFATATVPLIYALGAELCDRRVGLMAALLLTVNVSCIQFAQQARSYAMVVMLATLFSLLFVQCVKQGSLARYLAYTIAGTLCAYAHLFGVLMMASHYLALFLFPVDRKIRLRLTACLGAIGILSLPLIITRVLGEHSQAAWIPATSAKSVFHLFTIFSGSGLYWGQVRGLGWVLLGIHLASIAIAVVAASEHERPAIGFLLLSVLVPVTIVLLLSIFKPLFEDRYLLICLPFFIVLVARGITRMKPRAVPVGIAVIIVALSLSEDRAFYNGSPLQDWRGATSFVAANAKPGDLLVVFPGYDVRPVEYYVSRLSPPPDLRVITDEAPSKLKHKGFNSQNSNLSTFLAMHGVGSSTRVWIMTDQGHKDAPEVRALEAGHQVAAEPRFARVNVVLVE
jgi:mannosyltransferase